MSASGSAKSRMERILRLHDQIDEIKADIREVYAEEKGDGGDKTAMGAAISHLRKRAKDKDAFDEREALAAVYLNAYNGASHTHAREGSQSFAEAKGRARELTDTQEQPETATSSQHAGNTAKASAAGVSSAENDSDEISAPLSPSPETPQATADEEASPPAASSAPNPNPQPNLLPGAVKAPEADSSPASGAVLSEAEIPQFLKADRGFNNPRCKHPDTCSKAHSKDTCIDCTLAWADLPKAEQVLRWQDAIAASETEAA